MEDLSLHILDIAENSIAAGADRIEIKIIEDTEKDILSLEIKDNGRGIDEDTLKKVMEPFYTTRTTRRIGLGLPLLSQSAKEAEGGMTITSKKDQGTAVNVYFRRSHIDRKPLGNIADTLIVLIAGHPEMDFFYEHRHDSSIYSIDTREIKSELGDVPINYTDVISIIRKDVEDGIKRLG